MIKVFKKLWLNLFQELRSSEILAHDPASCHKETLSLPQTVVGEQACHCGTGPRPVVWDSLLAFGGSGVYEWRLELWGLLQGLFPFF